MLDIHRLALRGGSIRGVAGAAVSQFGDVGYQGDIEELLESPCNCMYCRHAAGAVDVHAGDAAICLGCGLAQWHRHLSQAYGCSYLCVWCLPKLREEIEAL